MQKKHFFVIFLLLILASVFFACNKTQYTITFESNGGSKVESVVTDGKSLIKMPKRPIKTNYTFDGWFYDNVLFRKPFKNDSLIKNPITSNLTVYARWRIELVATEGLEYELNDNAYTVIGYSGNSADIVIAENHNGYPVTRIAAEAFKDKDIKSAIISNEITEMGEGAFKGCASLESITLPFAGKSRTSSLSKESVFGYIFGCSETFSLFPILTVEQHANSEESFYYYIPSSLTSVTLTDTTEIHYGAFSNMTNLKEITINDSVSKIGENAFYNCRRLESIFIPESVGYIDNNAFYDCRSLTVYCERKAKPSTWKENWKNENINVYWDINRFNLGKHGNIHYLIGEDEKISVTSYKGDAEDAVIPATIQNLAVTEIKSYAFNNLSSVESITIPRSIKTIEIFSVSNCSKLKDISLPFTGRTKNDAEKNHFGYIFGASNSSSNKDFVPASIKKVTIMDGNIADNAFLNCENIEEIIVPQNITRLGDSAFRNCQSLLQISLPNSLTEISDYAFSSCLSLTDIVLPNQVESIGKYAFNYCASLASVQLPSTLTKINEYTFSNCGLLSDINLPQTLTEIGKRAFSDCVSLTSLNLPDNLIRIQDYAFAGCNGLVSVVIPSKVNYIGDWAFRDCAEITYIFVPKSVIAIGVQAFLGCDKLYIYCEAASKPSGYLEQWNGGRPFYFNSELN